MTSSGLARAHFPKLLSNLDKKRQTTLSRPLTSQEVDTLMAMRFNGEPVFPSIDHFYSEEFRKALESNLSPAELSKIPRYRTATAQEANMLYADIHERDEKTKYATSGPQEE